MKFKVTFEGDTFEDEDEFKSLAHLIDIQDAISETRGKIKSRIRWADISEGEVYFLQELFDILSIEGIE